MYDLCLEGISVDVLGCVLEFFGELFFFPVRCDSLNGLCASDGHAGLALA